MLLPSSVALLAVLLLQKLQHFHFTRNKNKKKDKQTEYLLIPATLVVVLSFALCGCLPVAHVNLLIQIPIQSHNE